MPRFIEISSCDGGVHTVAAEHILAITEEDGVDVIILTGGIRLEVRSISDIDALVENIEGFDHER